MYGFGIDGYRPDWRRGAAVVAFWPGPILAKAVGRRLTRAWVAWEVKRDRCFEGSQLRRRAD
ncbi:MAG TPA: hypothetical protein VGX23_09370 [Actinocrinis sp.]|nr:hypothetical protein [Actinocrinis sp.]